MAVRNTPTGVGKTDIVHFLQKIAQKHPHGCGEDLEFFKNKPLPLETPPRVWGRPTLSRGEILLFRNTPTGVGKTPVSCEWCANRTQYIVFGQPTIRSVIMNNSDVLSIFYSFFNDQLQTRNLSKGAFCIASCVDFVAWSFGNTPKNNQATFDGTMIVQIFHYFFCDRVFYTRNKDIRARFNKPEFHAPPYCWRQIICDDYEHFLFPSISPMSGPIFASRSYSMTRCRKAAETLCLLYLPAISSVTAKARSMHRYSL